MLAFFAWNAGAKHIGYGCCPEHDEHADVMATRSSVKLRACSYKTIHGMDWMSMRKLRHDPKQLTGTLATSVWLRPEAGRSEYTVLRQRNRRIKAKSLKRTR